MEMLTLKMNMMIACHKRTNFLENCKIRAIIEKTKFLLLSSTNIEIEIKSKTSLIEKGTKVAKLD